VLSPEEGLPLVRIDTGQIQRVILDLATHARDAMPNGGTLIVETRRVVLTEAYVAQHLTVQPGVYVMLAISDTGSGMDPEMQLHLFEPFTSAGRAATGFGLSAVHGIIRQSGGHIWVYSEPGHGTTFKIYLPEASARMWPSVPRRAQPLPRGRASVLVVEDEPGVRASARQVLEACGYTVVTASSGEEAIERCLTRGLEPDLLITDVVMPGISGSQLVAHLRSQRDGLRVLYTSGFTEDAVVHHGVASGEHFLSKPFTPADLANKVREVLGVTDDLV
jgi:two-component system, cell cycle sensor histidine kinase and response regulator CckA